MSTNIPGIDYTVCTPPTDSKLVVGYTRNKKPVKKPVSSNIDIPTTYPIVNPQLRQQAVRTKPTDKIESRRWRKGKSVPAKRMCGRIGVSIQYGKMEFYIVRWDDDGTTSKIPVHEFPKEFGRRDVFFADVRRDKSGFATVSNISIIRNPNELSGSC